MPDYIAVLNVSCAACHAINYFACSWLRYGQIHHIYDGNGCLTHVSCFLSSSASYGTCLIANLPAIPCTLYMPTAYGNGYTRNCRTALRCRCWWECRWLAAPFNRLCSDSCWFLCHVLHIHITCTSINSINSYYHGGT